MDSEEFQESTTVRLDWTIRGLKQLFESSKGETKSKVTKSVKFGGGRWQILFYPNSGTEGGQFVSLYLSCEPTSDEKDSAIDGRWIRSGLYKFSFELRNLPKTILFNQKEANDHSFSWKTANWGWAQFARRESVYYQPNTIRNSDAFLITCTITASPAVPSVPSNIPLRSVPKDLLVVVGSLLDDPAYSDVEFVLPKRKFGGRKSRRIFAARSILKRAEYFESMFGSGFVEASSQDMELSSSQSDTVSVADSEVDSSIILNSRQFEDSDVEDEAGLTEGDDDSEAEDDHALYGMVGPKTVSDSEENNHHDPSTTGVMPFHIGATDPGALPASTVNDTMGESPNALIPSQGSIAAPDERNVQAKLSHPSSPRQQDRNNVMDNSLCVNVPRGTCASNGSSMKGPSKKYRVVVRDVAYATYRAVLYYLYTDSIIFAPLASTFLTPPSMTGPPSQSLQPRSQGEGQNLNTTLITRPMPQNEHNKTGPTTRLAWIREWEDQNPGKPKPCSAKAVYRIADKLGLSELKGRAFQHIVKSLTIHNVPYEMFSSFSTIFDDVRKTQVEFFLEHWNEIRASQSMQAVWQQIRVGRHPGFEEVWPLIAMNLEFRPRVSDVESGDNKEGNSEAVP